MTRQLPEKFRGLEEWIDWSLETEAERHARRLSCSIAQLRLFSDALAPHMHDLIQHLSQFPWGDPLGDEDRNLYHLGLSYMEATIPLDLGWKSPQAVDSFPVERLNLSGRA